MQLTGPPSFVIVQPNPVYCEFYWKLPLQLRIAGGVHAPFTTGDGNARFFPCA